MKYIYIIIIIILFVFFSPSAEAMLADLPPVSGFGYFEDPSTGNVWMDVDNFFDMSYYEVEGFLSSIDFRLATLNEVQTLHLTTYPINYSFLADTVGSSNDLGPIIAGYYDSSDYGIAKSAFLKGPDGSSGWEYSLSSSKDQGASWVGAWAINDDISSKISAIPEPQTVFLMIFGLGLIGFIKNKKR